MIDVVFILLVFFMLASQFAEWKKISLTPSVTSGTAQGNVNSHTLHLLNTGKVALDGGKAQDVASLVHALASKVDRPPLHVTSDDEVTMQALIDVVEQLTAKGFKALHMRTKAESTTR